MQVLPDKESHGEIILKDAAGRLAREHLPSNASQPVFFVVACSWRADSLVVESTEFGADIGCM